MCTENLHASIQYQKNNWFLIISWRSKGPPAVTCSWIHDLLNGIWFYISSTLIKKSAEIPMKLLFIRRFFIRTWNRFSFCQWTWSWLEWGPSNRGYIGKDINPPLVGSISLPICSYYVFSMFSYYVLKPRSELLRCDGVATQAYVCVSAYTNLRITTNVELDLEQCSTHKWVKQTAKQLKNKKFFLPCSPLL